MKLSFSLPPKPSSKSKKPILKASSTSSRFTNDDDHHSDAPKPEYLTEFDPSKTLADSQAKLIVIPPKENEWRPLKKMKNLELPVTADSDPNIRFELESPALADIHDPSNMSYGLNLRSSSKGDSEPAAESNGAGGGGGEEERPRSVPVENLMLEKLKEDLDRLPEDRGFEEFADVPVEGFGAALLRGYGWHEGRGIGRNAKEDVKVKQYKKRAKQEGLGFFSDVNPPSKGDSNKDSTEKQRDSERSNSRKEKEKEKDKARHHGDEGIFVGKDVRIIEGRNIGLRGRVVETLDDSQVVLKLSRSQEEVTVRVRDVADLGSKEEEKCLKKLKELNIHESKGSDDKKVSKRSREVGGDTNGASHRTDDRREQVKSSQVSWLASHIRVRIISKDLKRGRLYLKKGQVVDVVGPTTCNITMDENQELVEGVNQNLLETALPRRGGPVLVLNGKHKGVYGSLVEKDLERDTAVVRDADNHALLNVRLDQIAEYIGDPSYIGY